MTIAGKESRRPEPPAPMPRTILVGDQVRLNPLRCGPYVLMYGQHLREMKWTVINMDKVGGGKRLYVEGTPSAIFLKDAVLAYPQQSKTRRELLTKAGVKL
jgi:hypothetical protein